MLKETDNHIIRLGIFLLVLNTNLTNFMCLLISTIIVFATEVHLENKKRKVMDKMFKELNEDLEKLKKELQEKEGK